jgi:hypothetical protein
MMHSYSPNPRQLAVPGIGFPQSIPVGPDVFDLAAFRDWSDDRLVAHVEARDDAHTAAEEWILSHFDALLQV